MQGKSSLFLFFLAAVVLVFPLDKTHAQTQEQVICKRIMLQQQAASNLLFFPNIYVQGAKIPRADKTSLREFFDGETAQLISGLSYNFLNIFKGVFLRNVAEFNCVKVIAQQKLYKLLSFGMNIAHYPALKKKLSFFKSKLSFVKQLSIAQTQQMVDSAINPFELQNLYMRVQSYEMTLSHLEEQVTDLEAARAELPQESLPMLLRTYTKASLDVDKEQSLLRRLNPWNIGVSGGHFLQNDQHNWFAYLNVNINLGALAQYFNEEQFVDARREELKISHNELPHRIAQFVKRLKLKLPIIRQRLALLTNTGIMLKQKRQLHSTIKSPKASYYLGMIDLDMVNNEAERIYCQTYVTEGERWLKLVAP